MSSYRPTCKTLNTLILNTLTVVLLLYEIMMRLVWAECDHEKVFFTQCLTIIIRHTTINMTIIA